MGSGGQGPLPPSGDFNARGRQSRPCAIRRCPWPRRIYGALAPPARRPVSPSGWRLHPFYQHRAKKIPRAATVLGIFSCQKPFLALFLALLEDETLASHGGEALDKGLHTGRTRLLHLVCYVSIDIQRERGGSMAQIALHRFGTIPSPERRRRNGNNGCLSRGPAHGKAFAGRIGHSIAGCFRTGCCLVKPAGLGPSPPGLKRDFGAACLTKRRTGDMMHRTEKALKRTLSGHDSREGPPLAASGSGRGPGHSHRLGAAHRYVGWDGTSRYRGHERHPI